MEATRRPSSGTAAAEKGFLWHDGHQGPYRRIHDEAGHTGTRHALPEPFRIRYRTIGSGRGQPVAQLPSPPGAEVMW